MTTDIPTGSKRMSRFMLEEFLASGVIVLGVRQVGGRLVRTIYVRKMRWSSMDSTMYVFVIEPEKGIVIGEPFDEFVQRLNTTQYNVQQGNI
jgi:circadian clock protein KaiC